MSQDFKVTTFDSTYSQRLASGDTILGGSSGSNSFYVGGDVLGGPGDLSVVGLRSQVSLASNINGALGDVLTIISVSPRTAAFAAPSNSGFGSTIPFDHGNMGSTETVDLVDGDWHRGTLDAACTISIAGFTIDLADVLVFKVTQDGTGGWGITWDPDTVSLGSTQPDLAAGAVSWFVLWSDEGDATVYLRKVPTTSGSLPWFTVTDYGATGNGSTDDTAAFTAWVAAWNAAGRGVGYIPAGTYKTSGGFTITASGVLLGDGMGAYDGSAYVSAVLCTSQTANLFTVTGKQLEFRDIGLFNTYGGTASAGSGIHVNGTFIGQKVDLTNVVVSHFYDNVVRDVGSQWANVNVWNWGAVRYGESIQNTVNQDAGDWSILGSYYYADTNNGTAAIHQTGAGGGKIAATKFNGHGGATYTTGIDLAIATSHATSILLLSGVSIENVSGDAVRLTTTGSGTFYSLHVVGCQVGLFSNNTGRAVKVSAATAGGVGVGGGISAVMVDGCTFRTDGTARAAVELVNTDKAVLGEIALIGFNARYTSSGDTNTTDGAAVTFGTPAVTYGTPAAGAASTAIRTDATLTPPTDAQVTFTDITTNNVSTSKHGYAPKGDANAGHYLDGTGAYSTPAGTAGTQQHILLADGHATPFTFNDLLQMDDGSDFMWSDPE